MADYKSQQIGRGSISDILQLLEAFSSGHERARGTMVDKRNALVNQLSTTTSLDSLNNQLSQIEAFNQDASISGYDEYSINVGDMKNAYTNANSAYEKAKAYQDGNLGDADALYDNVMGMTWEQAHEELRNLDGMVDAIGTGEQHKFRYKANDQYSGTSLKNALVTRRGIIQNKLKVFEENSGEFLVWNADGTMDEASRQIYDDLQFKILNPDTQDFSGDLDKAKDLASGGYLKREKEWVAWKQIQQQIANNPAPTIEDVLAGTDENIHGLLVNAIEQLSGKSVTGDMLLDPGWVNEMVENSKEAANKYNRQYEVYTGEIFQKTPWEDTTPDLSAMGASSDNPVNLTGKNDRVSPEDIYHDRQLDYRYTEGEASEVVKEDLSQFEEKVIEEEVSEEVGERTDFGVSSDDVESEFDDYIESEASSEGIDYNKLTSKITTGVILTGAAASNETVQNVGKAIYKATKDGAKYLNTAYNLSADDIQRIIKEVNAPKGNINKSLVRIKKLEKVLKNIDVKKDPLSKKRLQITNQINRLRKEMVESLSKRLTKLGSKVRPEDVARLMSNKEMSRWNPIQIKNYWMNKAPAATKKWLATSKTAGVGKGLLRFRAGAAIKDALGVDIGEGFIADTAEDIAATAAATGILNKAGKWLTPKLHKIVTSPAGQKALQKFLTKQAAANVTKQMAGSYYPGWGNVAMAIVGAGMTGYDFVQFVRSFKEE